jgi:hypothetical protein
MPENNLKLDALCDEIHDSIEASLDKPIAE